MSRGVVTIAVGKPVYFEMATALACSFERWNLNNDIEFALVTDLTLPLPRGLQKTRRLQLQPGEVPLGFESKLHMDELSPFATTLFVDSDCLCFSDLSCVFEQFKGRAFSNIGSLESSGEYSGNIEKRCAEFNVPHIPVFVGAVYYFERNAASNAVLERARALLPDYDRYGFWRLRNRPNEEPLLSVAMAELDQRPLTDDGSVKVDAMYCRKITCDVLTGRRIAVEKDLGEVTPAIIHFNDAFAERPPYTTEKLALRLVYEMSLPPSLARLVADFFDRFPKETWRAVKDLLRAPYHKLFGVRAIVSANR